jgi:hypothetical protein
MIQKTLKDKYLEEDNKVMIDNQFILNLRKRLGNQMDEFDNPSLANSSNEKSKLKVPVLFNWGRFLLSSLSLLFLVLIGIIGYNYYISLPTPDNKVVDEVKITTSQAKEIFQKQIDISEDKTKVYFFKTIEREPYNPGLTVQNEYFVDTWIDQQTGSYKKVTEFRGKKSYEVSNLVGIWKYNADNEVLEETIYDKPLQNAIQTSSLLDLLRVLINTNEFTFKKYQADKTLIYTTINVDEFQKRDYYFDKSSYELKRIDVLVRQNNKSEYNMSQTIEVKEQKLLSRELVDITSVFNIDKSILGNYTIVPKDKPIAVTPTQNLSTKKLKVYFLSMSKFNEYSQTDYLSERFRYTTRADVATFTLEELIKGPIESEKSEGEKLIGLINLSGESKCGGKDFTISIKNGLATVSWCRDIDMTRLSDTQSPAFFESIEKTLKQFPTIQKVQMYDKNGNCLNDSVSGINRCE